MGPCPEQAASTPCPSLPTDLGSMANRAFQKIVAVLREHHFRPDIQAARGLYAAVAAHRLPGQPVWPMLVAPPGSLKTELLQPLEVVSGVHLVDKLTPNTFLSGQISENRRGQPSPSLLHRIGSSGILI